MLFELPMPPTLNTYYRNVKGKMKLSAAGRQYKIDVLAIVWHGCKGKPEPMMGRLRVEIKLHYPDKRSYDIDNRPKAVLDGLEEAGVYGNDNQVDALIVLRGDPIPGGTCWVDVTEIDTVSKLMEDNGLGPEDMENDIRRPR